MPNSLNSDDVDIRVQVVGVSAFDRTCKAWLRAVVSDHMKFLDSMIRSETRLPEKAPDWLRGDVNEHAPHGSWPFIGAVICADSPDWIGARIAAPLGVGMASIVTPGDLHDLVNDQVLPLQDAASYKRAPTNESLVGILRSLRSSPVLLAIQEGFFASADEKAMSMLVELGLPVVSASPGGHWIDKESLMELSFPKAVHGKAASLVSCLSRMALNASRVTLNGGDEAEVLAKALKEYILDDQSVQSVSAVQSEFDRAFRPLLPDMPDEDVPEDRGLGMTLE